MSRHLSPIFLIFVSWQKENLKKDLNQILNNFNETNGLKIFVL